MAPNAPDSQSMRLQLMLVILGGILTIVGWIRFAGLFALLAAVAR